MAYGHLKDYNFITMPPAPKKKINNKVPAPKINKGGKGTLKANSLAGGGTGIFSQFEGAKYSVKRSWINTPWPADFKRTMTSFDRQELTRKMRWLHVNAGLIRQQVNDMCLYSVGSGIMPQVHTGNAVIDKAYEDYFKVWASKPCEITGRYNFAEVQQIACKKIDIDGEIFALKTYDKNGSPILQIIEAHRVGTASEPLDNNTGLWDGVLFDKYGCVTGYNIIRSDGTTRLVPASSILHIHHPETVTGARAYSPLQHSLNNMIDVLEILSLEKVAVKSNSDIVRTLERESGQFDTSASDAEAFGMRPQDYPNQVYNNPEQVGSFVGGKILSLAPGEKLNSFESQRPNSTFTGFVEHLFRDSCLGTLPYEFVVEPNKAGAAMRLVVAKAGRVFASRQEVLINRLLMPTWGYVIGSAIASGELPASDNWNRVSWVTPKRVTVDAGKEEAATFKAIQLGLKSFSEYHAENGNDARDHDIRRAADIRHAMDVADNYNIPFWTMYRPDNTALESITGEPDPTPENDADAPLNEGSDPL
jgi:lambda family phage portal protein